MASHTSAVNLYCLHSNHLWDHPLCEEQSLLHRITNVAFHILTLGIPFALHHAPRIIYQIGSYFYSRIISKQEDGNIQATGLHSVLQTKSIKPYSKLGEEAIEFARKKLAEHPEITPALFSTSWKGPQGTHQPKNLEIALLTNLYNDVFCKKFEELMEKNQNPWSNQEVINAADDCMKIAYAISNLTLDELKLFTDSLSSQGVIRSYAKALTKQDSYQYRTFYYCTNAYHNLRGAIQWLPSPWEKGKEGLFFSKGLIYPSHASLFYHKGTLQNSWNQLYNEYCDRIRLYVNEEELYSADSRHVNWTKKDTGVKAFIKIPDTQPS